MLKTVRKAHQNRHPKNKKQRQQKTKAARSYPTWIPIQILQPSGLKTTPGIRQTARSKCYNPSMIVTNGSWEESTHAENEVVAKFNCQSLGRLAQYKQTVNKRSSNGRSLLRRLPILHLALTPTTPLCLKNTLTASQSSSSRQDCFRSSTNLRTVLVGIDLWPEDPNIVTPVKLQSSGMRMISRTN